MHEDHGNTEDQSTNDVTDQRRDHGVPDVSTDTNIGAVDHTDRDVEHVDDDVLESEEDESHDWEMKDSDFGDGVPSVCGEPNGDTDLYQPGTNVIAK